jgi:hypothetical protein
MTLFCTRIYGFATQVGLTLYFLLRDKPLKQVCLLLDRFALSPAARGVVGFAAYSVI